MHGGKAMEPTIPMRNFFYRADFYEEVVPLA